MDLTGICMHKTDNFFCYFTKHRNINWLKCFLCVNNLVTKLRLYPWSQYTNCQNRWTLHAQGWVCLFVCPSVLFAFVSVKRSVFKSRHFMDTVWRHTVLLMFCGTQQGDIYSGGHLRLIGLKCYTNVPTPPLRQFPSWYCLVKSTQLATGPKCVHYTLRLC